MNLYPNISCPKDGQLSHSFHSTCLLLSSFYKFICTTINFKENMMWMWMDDLAPPAITRHKMLANESRALNQLIPNNLIV